MKNFKKFTIFLLTFLLLFSLSSYALGVNEDLSVPVTTSLDNDANNNSPDSSNETPINSDLYKVEDSYTLNKTLLGNGFIVCSNFTTSETESISGDLYIMAENVTLKSNVSYSTEIDKNNNLSIDTINSATSIYGNVFVIAKNFTIEPGVEIDGNLYVLAQNATFASQSKIYGNCYISAETCNLNAQIGNSLYVTAKDFTMGYYGFIYRDLKLITQNSKLNGSIYRNTDINSENITLQDNFLAHGDLTYSSKSEIEIKEDMVLGETTYTQYDSYKPSVKAIILNTLITIIAFVAYVFVAFIIIKYLFNNYLEKEFPITLKNVFISLGIGLLSFFVIAFISILLFMIKIGYILSLALLATFAFMLVIAVPLYIIDIAKIFKKNLLATVPIIATIIAAITIIPYVGSIFIALLILISIGNLISKIINKNKK